MWPLNRRPSDDGNRRDPAPTRWGYRYQRLMLTPSFRRFVRVWLPMLVVAGGTAIWLSSSSHRETIAAAYANVREQIEARPEFAVNAMEIEGADAQLSKTIRETLDVAFPVSSFDLDLEGMRDELEQLAPVRRADLRVRRGGILSLTVDERQPVAMWREAEGLRLVDQDGVLLGKLEKRSARPDLPLMVGEGARDALTQGLEIHAAAAPLHDRLRGLVRMGERRWDVVLDREQRIMLPSDKPVRALERVLALNEAQDMLARDIAVVDMRNADRPTIRLHEQAVAELRRIRDMRED